MAEDCTFTANRAFTAAAVCPAADGRAAPFIPAAVPFEGVRALYTSVPVKTGGMTVALYAAERLPAAVPLSDLSSGRYGADVKACVGAMEAEREKKRAVLAALPGRLVPWFAANKRALPWRETTDP